MKLYRLFSILIVLAMLFSFASTPDVSAASSSQAAPSEGGPGEPVKPTGGVTCLGCPVLKIVKTADAPDVLVNGLVGFTVTVTNVGPNLAQDIVLTDPLPAGTTWTDDSEFCDITGGTLSCHFGNIPINNSVSVHVTGTSTPQMCGTISNTATVTGYNRSTTKSNTVKVNIHCPADVIVTKTAEKSPVNAGETIRFTLVVKNQGGEAANGVLLSDILPTAAGLNWKVDSVVGGGSCQIGAGILSCDFGILAAGAERTVVISSPTTMAFCGTIDNTATVQSSSEPEEKQGNNSGSASITINCPVNFTITKTADDTEVNAGDPIGFRVTVTNTGTTAIPTIHVEDQLNKLVTWADDSADCAVDANGLLTCTFNNLAAGASASVHITATSSNDVCGDMANIAYAWVDGQSKVPSDEALIKINCLTTGLSVTKVADAPSVNVGDPIGFRITVTNTGTAAIPVAHLEDQLNNAVAWTDDSAACSIDANGLLSCAFNNLAVGASATVHITAASTSAICGSLENIAYAFITGQPRTPSNKAVITINCPVNVKVVKTAEKATLTLSDNVPHPPARFFIDVSNTGTGTAQSVTLSDVLPDAPGLNWVIDSVIGGGACSIETVDVPTLSCTFGDLAFGATRRVIISSSTDSFTCKSNPGRLVNTAEVKATNEPTDAASQVDNRSTATISFAGCECINLPYHQDFETVQPDELTNWTRPNGQLPPITVAPKGQRFLGELENESISLTLNFCPGTAGQNLMFGFDLYTIRSWDGDAVVNGVKGPGPDTWDLSVEGGPTLIHSTFSNWSFYKQSYPARSNSGHEYTNGTDSLGKNLLGYYYETIQQDTTYRIIVSFPLTEDTVTLTFKGIGLQGLADESWGIDNVEVIGLGNTLHHIPMLVR